MQIQIYINLCFEWNFVSGGKQEEIKVIICPLIPCYDLIVRLVSWKKQNSLGSRFYWTQWDLLLTGPAEHLHGTFCRNTYCGMQADPLPPLLSWPLKQNEKSKRRTSRWPGLQTFTRHPLFCVFPIQVFLTMYPSLKCSWNFSEYKKQLGVWELLITRLPLGSCRCFFFLSPLLGIFLSWAMAPNPKTAV